MQQEAGGMRERYETARRTGRPLLGAHRGNSAEEPENTLRAFASALELGVDLVECDVHLSSDGLPVVIHDHSLLRTAGVDRLVKDVPFAELRQLDVGRGERIPSLEEVIDLVRGRAGLVIELKQAPLPYPGLEATVIETLRAQACVQDTCLISFRHASVRLAKEMEPALQTGILEVGLPVDPLALLRSARADIYSPHFSGADPELVTAVHAGGGAVGLWVIDDDLSLLWARACAPDSLFTNRPREILEKLG